ncbi:MAG TPA: hypothetical protein VFE57_08075 [Cyclobacteriaceae bacterium]|nr:hypothetical protein [Cyclobacteriaceae bacterium]
MKSTAFSRFFMLTAGIVAAMVMLLSMSLNQSKVETNKSKPKTEQSASDYSIVNAPTDALPGSGTVQVEAKTLPLLETFLPIEKVQESIYLPLSVPVKCFKTLLKTVISPNAP